MKTAFLIAAPMSGSGKTTIARGLMALYTEMGYQVQPFKCGPDYIDTKFHTAVCGRPSINLDTFMASPEHVCELFHRYGDDADLCIVEGMMGLFDGYDRERGSAYEIARVLDIPVVLVVDARSAAYSTAALLSGFLHFRKEIRIVGVIYNKVGSEKHAAMLRQVCEDLHITCLGCLPKSAEWEQGSRYLGLDFSTHTRPLPKGDGHEYLQAIGKTLLEESFVSQPCKDLLSHTMPLSPRRRVGGEAVLVARNAESFSFCYQETLDRWEDVQFFDPETDIPNLDQIDLLYLPGGYPEKHAQSLANNEECRKAIRDFAFRGGRIVAECGGMMFLCKNILTDEGEYPMCGVLPYTITARKADRKLSLGYRRFVLDGKEYRGHEFHYTQFLGEKPDSIVQVYDAKGNPVPTPVFRYKNVLASYTHLYQI